MTTGLTLTPDLCSNKSHENEEVIVAECGVEFLNWENTLCQVSAIMQRVQGLWGNMRESALCSLGVEVR